MIEWTRKLKASRGKFSIIIIKRAPLPAVWCAQKKLKASNRQSISSCSSSLFFIIFSHHVSSYSSYTLGHGRDMTFEMLGRNPSHVDAYQDFFFQFVDSLLFYVVFSALGILMFYSTLCCCDMLQMNRNQITISHRWTQKRASQIWIWTIVNDLSK